MVSHVGIALAILAAFSLAGQALSIRLATRRGRAVDVLLVNLSITALVFTALAVVFVPDPVLTTTAVVLFVGAGFLNYVLGRALYFEGIKRVGASRAEPIKSSMPFHATVFAVLILGELVTAAQFGGILLIVVGIALVSWEGANEDRIAGDDIPWVGLALPFGAALFFGIEPALASLGFQEGTGVLVGGAIKSTSSALILLAFLAVRDSVPRPSDLPSGDVRWYVLSGVASAMTGLAYYAGLSLTKVTIVVPIMQTSPLVVVAVSMVFLQDIERVTLRLVAAAGVIISGTIMVTVMG